MRQHRNVEKRQQRCSLLERRSGRRSPLTAMGTARNRTRGSMPSSARALVLAAKCAPPTATAPAHARSLAVVLCPRRRPLPTNSHLLSCKRNTSSAKLKCEHEGGAFR
jgi:hypothetical protein